MNLEIKQLTPVLSKDYFDFFDNQAFSDGSPMQPCYCCTFNMTQGQKQTDILGQAEINGGGKEGLQGALRKAAEKLIQSNTLRGYLAFVDGVSIGWCNTNDKANYCRFDSFIIDNTIEHTKSIVCFVIAPEYRGKGIATALLKRVVSDARTDGYAAVEGYPRLREQRETYDHKGPLRLYEKSGFMEVVRQGNVVIMRKDL